MGQNSSSQLEEFVTNSLGQILNSNSSNLLTSDEVNSMSYEDFLKHLGELNKL